MMLAELGTFAVVMITLAIVGVVTAAASMLMKPKQSGLDNTFDEQVTPLANRGCYVPVVLGRRRIPHIFAWVGERKVVSSGGGGGGKGGGGGGSPKKRTYYEKCWSPLCVGPAVKIDQILVDGKKIFPMKKGETLPITSTTPAPSGYKYMASGTNIDLGKEGALDVYWGEGDQPVNEWLGDENRVGISSRWPYLTYVLWKPKNLGMAASWTTLNYEVVVPVTFSALTQSQAWIGETTPGSKDDGVNPAHAFYQLLCAPPPHGAGMSPNLLDLDSLEAVGVLCESEHLAFNLLISDGAKLYEKAEDMLRDVGVLIYNEGGKLKFAIQRTPAAGQTKILTNDLIVGSMPQTEVFMASTSPNRSVYVFKDRENQYKDMDVQVDDDGSAGFRGGPNATRTSLYSVTDKTNAAKVVSRRMQEDMSRPSVTSFSVTREGRWLQPGDSALIEGIGTIRILSVTRSTDTTKTEIEAMTDPYGVDLARFVLPSVAGVGGLPAEPDTSFSFFEMPYAMSPYSAIGVLRDRAHDQIKGAVINVSANDTAYYQVEYQDASAIGITLTSAMSADSTWIEEESATFTHGGEIEQALDLSGDDASWGLGRQLLLIDNELMFVQSISIVSEGTYRLNGVIRGRYDTEPAEHLVGSKGYLIDQNNLVPIRDPILVDGVTLYVKPQTYTEYDHVDVSDVTAVNKPFINKAAIPLPCDNFRGNDTQATKNQYTASGSVLFEWTYRVRNGYGAAAGEAPMGTPITNTIAAPEGPFTIEICNSSGEVVYTQTGISPTSWTATNANLKLWLGNPLPTTFKARLYQVEGTRKSIPREILLERV